MCSLRVLCAEQYEKELKVLKEQGAKISAKQLKEAQEKADKQR